ncbi:hypothetical protein [Longimicrobium sp.]|jgi:hypothetical protein|uniref:hypothetical protein n=1 Tax=Longimicrobium sp. TaxID=2029185 RepID=UPI002ED7FB64
MTERERDKHLTGPSNKGGHPDERAWVKEERGAGTGSGDWDEAERLAALLDARLDADAHADVLAHLATDDEALAAYAEAAAVTRALEEEDAAAGVTPLRPAARRASPFSGPRRWGAVAAVVAAVALAPLAWNLMQPPGLQEPGALAERLASTGTVLPAGWDPSPWGSTRSASDPMTLRARAIRIGARLVELELALRGQDPAAARTAAQVAILLGELPGSGFAVSIFRDIQARAGAPWAELEPLMEQGSEAAAMAGDDDVRLGAWLQAARIAAARKDAEFFRTRAIEAALDRLDSDPATSEHAQRIRALTNAEGARDWDALERQLAEILDQLG